MNRPGVVTQDVKTKDWCGESHHIVTKVYDENGWRIWEQIHGSQFEYVAKTLRQAIRDGVLTL